MKIGFIGTGVMGNGMIANLIKAGYQVSVFNRTKAHAEYAMGLGATWIDTPKQVAQENDLIITMVGTPQNVADIYFGDNGIMNGASEGKVLIDSTTSKPSLDKKIYEVAKVNGISALDAPVSGGDVGAKNGTLTIMVGGNRETFENVMPIFKSMGQQINLFGPAGSGQHTKMANQIMIAGTMTGMTEMLEYGRAAGLDLDKLVNIVENGSAGNWSLKNYAPRVLKDDFKPGFAAKHFLKDLRIALECAQEMNIQLPSTKLAKKLYEKMVDQMHLGNDGTQGLIKVYK
ncbi:NAD(P)-dependent oxidoreductase [Apilactobacillus ozensis]|uniref:NAD(P)-dependent oxidoreductase n=1 Tax=Apilactobacillus ozensis TaxID=866801 RepID=UPI00200A9F63|nr:NAD(P)-dependent oxidoreductase [Apilactobacillus ozensis]MCK8607166.1 NAD(P)-dependent oxidoreductase [Apilactobacillus ozensis]